MSFKTDIEIAQESTMLPIEQVAAKLGIAPENLEHYGHYKAKVDIHAMKNLPLKSKLVLVTAISPTPAGEGKTTTSIGLADALSCLGKKYGRLPARALSGPCIWREGRRCRRRLCSGRSYGGHQPPLYRRLPRHWYCQ